MTEEHKKWFDKLVEKRRKFAALSQDPDYKGMWEVLIKGIYSEDAHFIYELLQNAEDVKATSVKFILKEDGLYFIHNGTIPFTISDIDNYNENGHINAITAVGRTGKKISETIGKFGIGFKAVFQYTKTPHIYDPNFQFKIHDYIVPELLNNSNLDIDYDKQINTVFYFPFINEEEQTDNNKVKSKTEAYKDILNKLKDLDKPSLFLSTLNKISWEIGKDKNTYDKKIIETKTFNHIKYERIQLKPDNAEFLIFTNSFKENINKINLDYSYSVGFKIEENNLKPVKNSNAYCFFSTKQKTNLNFLFHAPFLLNSNREAIPENQNLILKDEKNNEHIVLENFNEFLITQLAKLAADSILILKDLKLINDNIINIIPYKKKDFYEGIWIDSRYKQKAKLFTPFFESIKQYFESEELLPGIDNYVKKDSAYWAQDNSVISLFSDEQLAFLIEIENAKWVFRNLVRNQTGKDEELQEYIEDCTENWYDVSNLLGYIDENFIEVQSDEWLHKFYEYLSKNNSYWSDVKTKPIFLNSERNAVPAFEKTGKEFHEILFLPSNNLNSSSKTICPELLKNDKSKEFIESFGIKQPSLKDEIYNQILPLYEVDGAIDTEPHFKLFFQYWKEEGRPEDFLNLIKDKQFILYKTQEDETVFRGSAKEIYYPSEDMQKYFESKLDTKFVDLENYYELINDEKDRILLREFLLKLGVSELPRIIYNEITDWNEKNKIKPHFGENLNYGTSGYRGQGTFDKIIDGCKEIISDINVDKSALLWSFLTKLKISKLDGVHKYFYYSQQQQSFESTTVKLLKSKKWLLSKNNELVAPKQISIIELSDIYEISIDLENLLCFKPTIVLSQAERIANKFENEEEAELAKKLLEEHKTKQNSKQNSNSSLDENSGSLKNDEFSNTSRIDRTIKDLDDLQIQFTQKNNETNIKGEEIDSKPEINFDEDEEFAKGIEDLKNQLEVKKSRVDLAENINNSIKYSYDWFLAYLKLLTTYSEKQDTAKQKSISFQEIKPYKTDNKYFLLCGASSYISSEIENADDFKVSLIFGNGKRENITVEGVSKKGQDLLIYCRENLPANILSRLSSVFKVEINFTPAIDLLERLYKAFTNRNNIEEWQFVQESMPSLNYLYGPPGTGKTTTLCNNINNILDGNPNAKFLVLTPTNKAADVVCKKLWEINSDIFAVRLSRPTDPQLEEEAIYRDVLDDEDLQSINVVASTIHRLPYFDIQNVGLLFQYEWDYVIFDESSMTGLHYIAFAIMALYKTNPDTNFIIAGDPKQIPPVIEIDDKELENFDFQDENIYKMMGLESFNPEEQEVREIDTIQNLNKQYRSIPQIGQLFSELSYSGLLEHDRAENKKESKQLPEKFQNLISSNVTFIDIPLNQDNSIYKVNKLFYSSYHTYCAILVSEIIKYFDSENRDENWSIGLIAPYKAQAILLNKLITSYGISENVKVYSDTVHGFQGDECDIVFFICNPNNYYYSGHKKSLLSKEYIYNVAISRAKDYLLVLHPYTAISNNEFINEIGIAFKNNFGNTRIMNAKEIEKKIFNDENYIENNSYVSGHDNVNVFGLSEMKYFIKANDTAIDIQLRDLSTNNKEIKVSKEKFFQTEETKIEGIKIVGKIDLDKFEKYKKK